MDYETKERIALAKVSKLILEQVKEIKQLGYRPDYVELFCAGRRHLINDLGLGNYEAWAAKISAEVKEAKAKHRKISERNNEVIKRTSLRRSRIKCRRID